MANRVTHELNKVLNELPAINDFYLKSSLASVRELPGLTEKDCLSVSGINMYYRVSGFELYRSENENSELLLRLSEHIVNIIGTNGSGFSFVIRNSKKATSVYIGTNYCIAQDVSRALKENLFNAKVGNEWIESQKLQGLQAHNCIIYGASELRAGDIDSFINTIRDTDCMVSFLNIPCLPEKIESEINCLDAQIERLQKISKNDISVGSSRARKITSDNQDVLGAMNAVEKVKKIYQKGRVNGCWQTAIYVSAPDEGSMRRAAYAMVSLLRKNSDQKIHHVMPSCIKIGYIPVSRNVWKFPNVFIGVKNYGGYYGNSLISVIDSKALSTLVALPSQPHEDYFIQHLGASESSTGAYDKFVPKAKDNETFTLGKLKDGTEYSLSINEFYQHAFVTGTTQFGKSTTVKQIIADAHNRGIPFIVIEAAKKDYWRITKSSQLRSVEVYSFGMDAKPLYINPFVPEENTRLEYHIQSLKSALLSIFDSDDPLPQILTNLIYLCYEKKGWDIQQRVTLETDLEFPRLSDLLENLDEALDSIGYGDEVKHNMKGVVRVRINSLINECGNYLNTSENVSIKALLDTSAVVEIDDFAAEIRPFIAGILAIKIDEYSRLSDIKNCLQRLLVLEEAHHLMPDAEQRRISPSRAHCSEYFSNLLAEVSAYGTGIIIVDQRPSAISSDAIANTGVKIIHHLEDGDDKERIGRAMSLTPEEIKILGQLERGEAIISLAQSKEKCRVSVNLSLLPDESWNCGYLYCDEKTAKDFKPMVSDYERAYIKANGFNCNSIKQCVDSVQARKSLSLSKDEKMCLAGYLGTLSSENELKIRQAMFSYYKMVCG